MSGEIGVDAAYADFVAGVLFGECELDEDVAATVEPERSELDGGTPTAHRG